MGDAGCIPALFDMIRNGEETREYADGWATNALSCFVEAFVDVILEQDGAVRMLVDVVKKASSQSAQVDAAQVLGAIAEKGQHQQAAIAQFDGIRLLSNLLDKTRDNYDTYEVGRTLTHIM